MTYPQIMATMPDARRDLLALWAAALRNDGEGFRAVQAAIGPVETAAMIPAAITLIDDVLTEHGIDPQEWIRGQQERLRDG